MEENNRNNVNIMDYIELSSSESDDDVPLNVRIANRTGSTQAPAATEGEDPDWVRSFTPAKAESPKQEISDYSDEDFINLTSQPVSEPNFSQGASQDASQEPARKKKNGNGNSRGPTKSELTLVTAPRLDDGLALLQVEENELNLSGDVGAVGRVKIDGSMALLDIKGTLFRGLPYVCNSACVMAVTADDEARISAVMNTAVLLKAEKNVFAEGNGVVDGHTFEDGMNVDSSEEMEGNGKKGGGVARKKNASSKK